MCTQSGATVVWKTKHWAHLGAFVVMSTILEKLHHLYFKNSHQKRHGNSVSLEQDQRCQLEQKGCGTMNTLSAERIHLSRLNGLPWRLITTVSHHFKSFSSGWLLQAKTVFLWELSPKTRIHNTTNMIIQQSKYSHQLNWCSRKQLNHNFCV